MKSHIDKNKKIFHSMIFTTLLVVLIPKVTSAQSFKSDTLIITRPNAIHLTVCPMIFANTANLQYDRILLQKMKRRYANIFLRVGTGSYIAWETLEVYFMSQGGVMLGKKNNHFESAFGYRGTWAEHGGKILFNPSVSFGYRWQKPDGKSVFRTGAGFPELIYIGGGFAF